MVINFGWQYLSPNYLNCNYFTNFVLVQSFNEAIKLSSGLLLLRNFTKRTKLYFNITAFHKVLYRYILWTIMFHNVKIQDQEYKFLRLNPQHGINLEFCKLDSNKLRSTMNLRLCSHFKIKLLTAFLAWKSFSLLCRKRFES